MFKSLLSAVVLVTSVAGFVYAQQGATKLTKVDKDFVNKAASGGLFEVRAGEYAINNAQSPEVKNFAQRMVTDHSKANQQLTQLSQQKGIAVPQTMDKTDNKTYTHLSKLSGTNFDRTYINQMIKDHEKDIKEFQNQAKNGQDPDLKAFASRTLPILQEHLRMAQSIAPTVGATAK